MKTNLKFYQRRTDSHRHPKIIMLVKSYNTSIEGLAAEARFWRFTDLISEAEDCILDLNERRNFAYVAQVLEMNISELKAFIELLKSDEISLIQEPEKNKFTAKKIQESLSLAMKEREKALNRFNKNSGKTPTSPEVSKTSPEVSNSSGEVGYILDYTILEETILEETTTTTTSKTVGELPVCSSSSQDLNEKNLAASHPPESNLPEYVKNLFITHFEREPKIDSEVNPFIDEITKQTPYVSREEAISLIPSCFQIAVQQGNTKTRYVIGIAKGQLKNLSAENRKAAERENKAIMRNTENDNREDDKNNEMEQVKKLFFKHKHEIHENSIRDIEAAISKNQIFKARTLLTCALDNKPVRKQEELPAKIEDFDENMPF